MYNSVLGSKWFLDAMERRPTGIFPLRVLFLVFLESATCCVVKEWADIKIGPFFVNTKFVEIKGFCEDNASSFGVIDFLPCFVA